MSAFRRYVVQNFGLKIFSLAMAVLLWAAVTHDQTVEDAFNVPIEFHAIPENLELNSETIPQAQVRVRGPSRVLAGLRSSDVHVDVDLSGALAGEHTYDLNAQRVVHVPRTVTVSQVIPGQLQVNLDWRSTRRVPVRPRLVGTPASGISVTGVTSNPAEITITGPRQRVSAVSAAVTDAIDVSNLTRRRAFVSNAYVTDPLVQVVRPVEVNVIVDVSRESAAH